jgi:hypothetical protein
MPSWVLAEYHERSFRVGYAVRRGHSARAPGVEDALGRGMSARGTARCCAASPSSDDTSSGTSETTQEIEQRRSHYVGPFLLRVIGGSGPRGIGGMETQTSPRTTSGRSTAVLDALGRSAAVTPRAVLRRLPWREGRLVHRGH